jgi:hypothetical protein
MNKAVFMAGLFRWGKNNDEVRRVNRQFINDAWEMYQAIDDKWGMTRASNSTFSVVFSRMCRACKCSFCQRVRV